MSDDFVPSTIEITGYAQREDTSFVSVPNNKGRLYTPARCKIYQNHELVAEQKRHIDAPAGPLALGGEWNCSVLTYQSQHGPMYFAYGLYAPGTDERNTLPSLKGRGAQPTSQNQKPQSQKPQANGTGAGQARQTQKPQVAPQAEYSPAVHKEAVVLMHKQAWAEALGIAGTAKTDAEVIATARLTTSIVMGWKIDGHLYPQACKAVKQMIAREDGPSEDELRAQEAERRNEEGAWGGASSSGDELPTDDNIPF